MPAQTNRFLVTAGIITLIQASIQTVYASFALAQYYCVVDFLHTFPLFIFIRILYFHNPDSCGARVNVGESIDELANQAFVLIQREPFTTQRTFIINCVSLGLGVIWVIGSILLIKGGTRKHHSNHTHWPWLVITLVVTLLDVFAVISYANDSFHTKTLDDIMQYINGSSSGTGNVNVQTAWAAYSMAILYSRFVILLLVNASLMINAIVDCTRFRTSVTSSEIERNQTATFEVYSDGKESDEVTTSSPSQVEVTRIPRPGLSQSFRTMKNYLFNRTMSLQAGSTRNSFNGGRSRNRAVNFPEDIEMVPTLENMLAEQRRRLDVAIIDTSGRRSPGQGSRLTHTHSFNNVPETSRGRRGTAVELQGQMPWSYMPAPANRMRDQLPPDEDLPPVPLPDYTAIQSARKASVHRAASSLSSITQKKDYSSFPLANQEPPSSSASVGVATSRRQVLRVQADASKEALQPDLDGIYLHEHVTKDALDKASFSLTWKRWKYWEPVMEPVHLLPVLQIPTPPSKPPLLSRLSPPLPPLLSRSSPPLLSRLTPPLPPRSTPPLPPRSRPSLLPRLSQPMLSRLSPPLPPRSRSPLLSRLSQPLPPRLRPPLLPWSRPPLVPQSRALLLPRLSLPNRPLLCPLPLRLPPEYEHLNDVPFAFLFHHSVVKRNFIFLFFVLIMTIAFSGVLAHIFYSAQFV